MVDITELKKAYNNGFITGIMAYNFIRVGRRIDKSWYIEDIRSRTGLGDISFSAKRVSLNKNIDAIYSIYVDNGVVRTAIRYHSSVDMGEWQDQFTLGSGTAVAIAFNGYWDYHNDKWRMLTSETPHLFWVDSGNLYMQIWDDEATKLQLATDVVKVKAIRAWRNVNIPEVDQGLVVGYIKSDGVYYRNYAYQEDGSVLWEPERQVYAGTVNNLNLFLTNDYRMGFAIEDSSNKIRLYITDRVWAGMALEQDKIAVTAKAEVAFAALTYHKTFEDEIITVSANAGAAFLFGATDNTIIGLENLPMTRFNEEGEEYQDWGFIVRVTLDYFAVNIPTITLVDTEHNSQIPVSHIEEVVGSGGFQFDVYVDDVAAEFGLNTVQQTVQVTVSGAVNEAGYTYDTMVAEFTPVNLVPPTLALPEVEAIWNE